MVYMVVNEIVMGWTYISEWRNKDIQDFG